MPCIHCYTIFHLSTISCCYWFPFILSPLHCDHEALSSLDSLRLIHRPRSSPSLGGVLTIGAALLCFRAVILSDRSRASHAVAPC